MNDRFTFRFFNTETKKYMPAQYVDETSVFLLARLGGHKYTIEQCTGLKDKNGRLIYENDIVRITGDIMTIDPRYDNKLYVVNYSDLSFGFDMVGEEKGTLYGECWDYEVVGNIHENPELLEN